ncbi:MAG: HAD family hydrolase [Anaerolineae bacterium]|nr:HAD family hydrolase [Anaerolineae bacterium]MDQ7036827.1 HAD family hydrolase [Anaerolineae bacterium]
MTEQRYIAMWSGPRNISTAMLRSWGNRADTWVVDEPFYAHYLTQTEHDHPGAEAIIDSYETDWRKVAQQLTGDVPHDKAIYYQKHMTHHMLPHMDKTWMQKVTNCFLLREPRLVVKSFAKVIRNPKIDQTGFPQQLDIFNSVRQQSGTIPPVIDAQDVLRDPRRTLSKLCEAINVPFDEAMLSWAAGKRETDGIWAEYWYAAVEQSTEFMPYKHDESPAPQHLQALVDECQAIYEALAQYKL